MIRPPYDGTPVVLVHLAVAPIDPADGPLTACSGQPFRNPDSDVRAPLVFCPGCHIAALRGGHPVRRHVECPAPREDPHG